MNTNSQNIQTINQKEELMNSAEQLIKALHNHFSSNPIGYTEYRKEIESMLRNEIKPIASRSKMSSNGNDWRSELKTKFGGRGAKWIFVPLNEVEETIKSFESNNIDCSTYRKFTQANNKAWIRFSGGRVNNGIQSAAFEVRTEGSKIDHPKQLHYIAVENLDDIIETMPGTPHSLKLEEDSSPIPNKKKEKVKVNKKKDLKLKETKTETLSVQEIANDLNKELTLPEPPESNNPSDWESFLADEGLSADFGDDDIFENL